MRLGIVVVVATGFVAGSIGLAVADFTNGAQENVNGLALYQGTDGATVYAKTFDSGSARQKWDFVTVGMVHVNPTPWPFDNGSGLNSDPDLNGQAVYRLKNHNDTSVCLGSGGLLGIGQLVASCSTDNGLWVIDSNLKFGSGSWARVSVGTSDANYQLSGLTDEPFFLRDAGANNQVTITNASPGGGAYWFKP